MQKGHYQEPQHSADPPRIIGQPRLRCCIPGSRPSALLRIEEIPGHSCRNSITHAPERGATNPRTAVSTRCKEPTAPSSLSRPVPKSPRRHSEQSAPPLFDRLLAYLHKHLGGKISQSVPAETANFCASCLARSTPVRSEISSSPAASSSPLEVGITRPVVAARG